jgi:hypothetical protein
MEYFVSSAPLQWIFQRSNRGDIPRGTGGDKEKCDRKLPQPRRRQNRRSGFPALVSLEVI